VEKFVILEYNTRIMGRKDSILPGLKADGLAWHMVPHTDLATTQLVPGLVVTGFRSIRDYNALEDRAIEQLTASISPRGPDIASRSAVAARSRLSEELRIPGYYGPVDGNAFVFPFDHGRITKYPGASYRPNPVSQGLTFLIMARTTRVGTLVQEVSYYQSIVAHEQRYDAVRRAFGGRQKLEAVQQEAAVQAEASAARALQLAKYALSRVYSGGGPGTGKEQRGRR
jgi:hypothetical protein